MAAKLIEQHEEFIESLTLIPGEGGVYEVTVNDQLLYSKLATRRHAEPGEVEKLVAEFIEGKK